MEFEDIALAAFRHREIEAASIIELRTYEVMRGICADFAAGRIDRQEATTRKNRLAALYGSDCTMYRMYDACKQRERAAQGVVTEMQACGCEHCRRYSRIISGWES